MTALGAVQARAKYPLPEGTEVEATLFDGRRITGVVTTHETNEIFKERSTYDLIYCNDGLPHWCYAYQIVRAVI